MFCWWQKMFSKNLSLGSESFSFVLSNGLKYKCWNFFWASTTRISVSILNTLYSSRITLINFHHVMEFRIQFFSSLRLTFVLFWKTIFNKNYFKLFVYALEVRFWEWKRCHLTHFKSSCYHNDNIYCEPISLINLNPKLVE